MPNHVHGIVVIRERSVDARGVGTRHDASGIGAVGAPDTNALDPAGIGAGNAPDTNANVPGNAVDPHGPMPDDPGIAIPDGDPNMVHAHGQRTGARHDAPLRIPRKPPGIPRGALGQIVASYKSAVTRMAYRDGLLPHGVVTLSGAEGWQRNYWDRVIRNDAEYDRIAQYIRDNPANWTEDRFNQ